MNLSELSAPELLALHAKVADELRTRGIIRSGNGLTGDLAEHLFCKAFSCTPEANSKANFDAFADGHRYQIKGRRITRYSSNSRELGALRNVDGFDTLAAVLFSEDFSIKRAALIPVAVVTERATHSKRVNAHKFLLRDEVWDVPGVRDVTVQLCAVKF